MSRNRTLAVLLLMTLALGLTAYAAGGGTGSDPLISLSYLKEIFTDKVNARLDQAVGQLNAMADQAVSDSVGKNLEAQLAQATAQAIADRVAEKVAASGSLDVGTMTTLTLSRGDRVVGQTGTGFILQSGTGKLEGSANAEILNLTLGGVRNPGPEATKGYYYMLTADDGSGLLITSDKAQVLVRDGARVQKPYTPQYEHEADALKQAGLFVGTNNGYELERAPTRQEALIMLIRMLGEEDAALTSAAGTTFQDLTGWAEGQRYIAYGHSMGYTNGESATTFAQYKNATLEMYLSFTLRALGYSDAAGDFVWNTTSRDLAVQLGLLSWDELAQIDRVGFMRDHVAHISSNALAVPLKNSGQTLGQSLVSSGAITQQQLDELEATLWY